MGKRRASILERAARGHPQRRARLALFGALALFASLGGCSTAFDRKPIVTDTVFGLPFEATLENVFIGRIADPSEGSYSDTAVAAANLGMGDPVSATVRLAGDLVASIAKATVSDTERRLASARCVYILRPHDPTIADTLREGALSGSASTTDDGSVGDTDEPAEEGSQGTARVPAPETVHPPTGGEEGGTDRLISLTQICNPDLVLGAPVMVTMTSTAGTIHPIRSNDLQTVGDVMRLRDVLPAEQP